MQRESWGLYIIPIKAPNEKFDPKLESYVDLKLYDTVGT